MAINSFSVSMQASPLLTKRQSPSTVVRFGQNNQPVGLDSNEPDSVSCLSRMMSAFSEQIQYWWNRNSLRNDLADAIYQKDLAKMQAVLHIVPRRCRLDFLQQMGDKQYAPLEWAAWAGNAKAAKVLIEAVPKAQRLDLIQKSGQHQYTALDRAAKEGHVEVAGIILQAVPKVKRRAFIEKPNQAGSIPLRLAMDEQNWDVAGLFLAYGVNPGSEEERQRIVIKTLEQRNQHRATLTNPQAEPEEKIAAGAWLRAFPPNGGALNWQQADADQQTPWEDNEPYLGISLSRLNYKKTKRCY